MRSLKKLFIFCLAAMLIGFAGYEVSAQKGKKWKKDNNNRREMQKRRSEKKNEKRERRAEKRRGGDDDDDDKRERYRRGGDDDDDRRERYGQRGNDRREAIKRRIENQRDTRRARYDRRDDYRRADDNRREVLKRRAENRRDYLKREKKYEKMIAKQQREYYKDQRKYNKQIRKREKDQRRDRRDDYGSVYYTREYYARERDYPQERYYRQERYDQPENNVLTVILGTLGMAFGQTAPSYDSYDNNYDQNRYYDDYSYVARDDYYYENERNAPPVYYQNDPYANQAYGNDVLPIDTGKDWLNQILGVALTSFLSQNGNDYLSAVEPYQPFYSGFQQDNSYLYDPYYLDGYDMGYAPAY